MERKGIRFTFQKDYSCIRLEERLNGQNKKQKYPVGGWLRNPKEVVGSRLGKRREMEMKDQITKEKAGLVCDDIKWMKSCFVFCSFFIFLLKIIFSYSIF